MAQLYIALWSPTPTDMPTYEWGLVITDRRPSSGMPVPHLCFIAEDSETGEWKAHDLLDYALPDRDGFLGCVELPLLTKEKIRTEDLLELIKDSGPNDTEGRRLGNWSCSLWVMGILKVLAEEYGLLDMNIDENEFLGRVEDRAESLAWAGSDDDFGIVVVDY